MVIFHTEDDNTAYSRDREVNPIAKGTQEATL